jgi:mannose-6-phosphate isomerase-like protein (cupin superfamily)
MPKAGEVLENPVSGQRLVFRRTARETNGESLEYELLFRPSGFLAEEHFHPRQSERHEVLEGELGLVVAGEERRLAPGEALVVPPGAAHRLFPVGERPARMLFELRPALETERFIATLYRLAAGGNVKADGSPTALQLAFAAHAFPDVGYATRPPVAVQRAFTAVLAPIGRLRGYRVAEDD